MPDSSSSIERRRLLVAVVALVFSRHAAGRPQGSTPLATGPGRGPGVTAARSLEAAFTPLSEVSPAPQLAEVYTGQVDPSRCFVSEKYDGVRALWDGRVLRHRSGRAVSAPPSFVASLPAAPLDGELWLGRGRFDALSARVGAPSRTSATGATCATWCSTRRSAVCLSRRAWRVWLP
jgi:hypothetical protein